MHPPDRSREPTDNRITIHQMGANISADICIFAQLQDYISSSVPLIIIDWNNVNTAHAIYCTERPFNTEVCIMVSATKPTPTARRMKFQIVWVPQKFELIQCERESHKAGSVTLIAQNLFRNQRRLIVMWGWIRDANYRLLNVLLVSSFQREHKRADSKNRCMALKIFDV